MFRANNNSRMDISTDELQSQQQRSLNINGLATTTTHEENSIIPEQTLKRFESASECSQIDCILQQLRDHYHCEDRYCVRSDDLQPGRRYLKTFCKKEEIVRHCKWHKKRAETLKFGFLRFSCMDDCQLDNVPHTNTTDCQFNGKQTHYHCIETDCDKVYISTSDVQMHANYHRKTNAIRMQGFLRVRNLETCQEPNCPYAHQQTTHFHCLRDGCQFTFKNKGEMEKHKVYHLKDEQLLSDGFKKFFKADTCRFANCRYDGKLNHIHCIRPNCNYVFHSSGQLMSHKRKHEKNDQLGGSAGMTNAHNNLSDCDTSSVSADNSLLDLSTGVKSVGNSITSPHHQPSTNYLLPMAMNTQPAVVTTSHPTGQGSAVPTSANRNILQITSIDGLFNRKRGRPPKNRFVEVYNANHARTSYPPQDNRHGSSSSADSPQAIFASFKLDKSVTGGCGSTSAVMGMKSLAEGSSSRQHIRKKAKLVEQSIPVEDSKPVVGVIKSKGIFFPNPATLNRDQSHTVEAEECQSNSSAESNANTKRYLDEEEEEEHEHPVEEKRENGNGNSDISMHSFGAHKPHEMSHLLANNAHSFVPNMFPVNLPATEHNNNTNEGVTSTPQGMPILGMEWLKYAYQQPNPLMVFATTAALLAASMNSSQQPMGAQIPPPAMDPSLLEYAKNMFLYNNFKQIAEGQGSTNLDDRESVNGHHSGEMITLWKTLLLHRSPQGAFWYWIGIVSFVLLRSSISSKRRSSPV